MLSDLAHAIRAFWREYKRRAWLRARRKAMDKLIPF